MACEMDGRLRRQAEDGDELAADELVRSCARSGQLLDLARVPSGPVRDAVDRHLLRREPARWARIEPGVYTMGSPEDEPGRWPDEHQHEATVPRPFLLGTAPVTQAEWMEVMGTSPSHFSGDELPVECVSWLDAAAYCNARSRRDGLPECYEIDGELVEWVRCGGWRLPTEVEWEYAARAGTTGARHGDLEDVAWWCGNAGGHTHPVRQKQPNAWGLYDMLGNVWEWCWDRYEPRAADTAIYPDEEAVAPPFDLARSGSSAVVAGTAVPSALGRRTDVTADRRTESATSDSASPDEEAGAGPFGLARTGSSAVAAGATSTSSAGWSSATTSRRRAAPTSSASASPDEEEACGPFCRTGPSAVDAGTYSPVTTGLRPATPTRRFTAPASSAFASPDEAEACGPFGEEQAGPSAAAAGAAPTGADGRRPAPSARRRSAADTWASASRGDAREGALCYTPKREDGSWAHEEIHFSTGPQSRRHPLRVLRR